MSHSVEPSRLPARNQVALADAGVHADGLAAAGGIAPGDAETVDPCPRRGAEPRIVSGGPVGEIAVEDERCRRPAAARSAEQPGTRGGARVEPRGPSRTSGRAPRSMGHGVLPGQGAEIGAGHLFVAGRHRLRRQRRRRPRGRGRPGGCARAAPCWRLAMSRRAAARLSSRRVWAWLAAGRRRSGSPPPRWRPQARPPPTRPRRWAGGGRAGRWSGSRPAGAAPAAGRPAGPSPAATGARASVRADPRCRSRTACRHRWPRLRSRC